MSLPRPVPSKAALNALRGILFTTSCSVVLLAEERRQRTKIARAAVDNARKLHTVKARRNSVPLVDARAPDGDWHVVDLNNLPRRRKRRKESSIERSKSASPRIDDQSKPSRAVSDLADCDGTSRARSNDWPLDAKSRADLRDAESARTGQQRHSRVGSDEFRLLDASTWRPIAPHVKLTDKGDNNAKLHGYAEALSQSSGSFAHLRSSVDPLASVAGSACYPEIDWASPEWGSQEEMTAFYDEGIEALDPSDVEWGLPYWTRGSRNSKFATPEDRQSQGNERLLPPSSYDELWTSQDSASNEYRRTQSRLYRSLREIQITASDDISQEHADLIIRAKMYLLYSPRDEEGRTEFFRRLAAPGSMVRSFNGAKASARKLLEDLWRAAKDTDPERKIASHYLNLAIDVLRSFPGVEHRMAGSSHPAGLGVTKRLIHLATVRDQQALGEIFDIILPNCVDTTGFISKLFQFLHSRNDGVDSIRCLLQHFSSQPSHRYGFVCDEVFVEEVLRKHGRMLGQPEATQKVYAAVREANSTGFMDISRNVDFGIHLLLLEGAMVHNAPSMISSELRELEDIDGKRFAEDPFFRNAAILDTILNATPENFESVVERIEELRTSDSEVFSRALTHVVNMCQQRLPPDRFLEITWMLIGRHELPIEDQWAHFGLEHYLSASKPDFYALHSWLQHCKESGWSPSDDTIAYVDWHLGLYGDVTPNMSIIDNVLEVADQCASREERRQEAKLMRGYTFHLSPQEEQPVSVEMDRQVTAFEMQRLELRQHVFWRNIRAMRALEPWEKRWLMNAARACLNEEMSDEHKRRFDIMWNHINKSIFKAAWSVFARNYKPCQCPPPILRLAVMARLRIDGDDLSITEQLIDEVHAQGQNVDDLLEPLLRAQLDRDRPDKPGPTSVIAQALQKGHKISDQVYNYAARAAFKTRNSQGAIAICKLAATHNGDGNLIYCVENFSNLMRGYVTILGFRELSSLLYTLVEQNPSYTGTRVFRDAFRSATKVMASRAVAKEEKCSRTVAAKCRQFLEFMVKVRSELVYDAHRISRPDFVVQADKLRRDKYMSTADRRKHFSQILSPISEQQIADLAVDSPRQTWLWSPSDPSAVDAPDDDVSSEPHEKIGTSPETDNGRPADSALNAVISWGLEEASPQMAEESLNRAGGAATPGRHAVSPKPLASHGANAGVAFDRVFIGPSTSFRSDITVPSIEGQTTMGKQNLQHSATASFLRQWADEGAVDKRGEQGRARSASNGNLLRPADRFALKPNVSRKAWGWDESKHRPTPFDKIAAARRTDRPAEHVESTW